MTGPKTQISDDLHAEKYRSAGEDFRESMNRIAGKTSSEARFHETRDMLLAQRFLPGGRIQATIGTAKKTTPLNCFTSSVILDQFTGHPQSIMGVATEAAETMRMGGGIGFNFGTIRPRGSLISSLNSHSSGPVAFMGIFDAVCRCVQSAGHRRGAMMGVFPIDHPDIMEFIHAKQNTHALTSFNISVGVTDDFMIALQNGEDYELKWAGHVYGTLDASEVWQALMRSAWDWAEPGVLFLDTINRTNNLWYCEDILCSNPCAEQPMPPNSACLLGSFNLVKYLMECGAFDWKLFGEDIRLAVRMMDRIIDIGPYPLKIQEDYHRQTRRMGLGVTALANCIEAMGFPYGSEGFLDIEQSILRFLAESAYRESVEMAKEFGSFPLLDREKFLQSPTFASTLPEDLKDDIRRYGIRNSHLTSIAPCGTISLCADNVSSSIEPVFEVKTARIINRPTGPFRAALTDYGFAFLGTTPKVAKDVSIEEHLAVLLTAQGQVDSAVSKTLNVPKDTPWTEFQEIYVKAWEGGAKGCTTYQVGGKRFGILEKAKDDDVAACYVNPVTGKKTCE